MDKTRIMIVEDEGIVALDIARQLMDMGFEVVATASSGEEAVEKVGEHHPDLVLMDVVLSGTMDGIQAADIIRSRSDIPIIFLTAHADQKIVDRAKGIYPLGYILKPFEFNALRIAVEMALYISRADRERRKAVDALHETLKQLETRVRERTIELEETNIAMRVLLRKENKEQQRIEDSLQSNVDQLVTPFLSKLRKSKSDHERKTYLNILETNLDNIVSPFINRLSAAHKNLTPKEIQIAELVRQGKKSREIAKLLGVAVGTVVTHRNKIRKKLGLKSKNANLRSHLLSLA